MSSCSVESAVMWFAVSLLVATTGFSIVSINLNMIGGFWFKSQQLCTKVAAWRESLGLIGLLTAAILPTVFVSVFDVAMAYQLLVLMFSLLLLIGMLLFSVFFKTLGKQHLVNNIKSVHNFSFFPLLFGAHKRFFLSCFFITFSVVIACGDGVVFYQ